MNEKEYALTKVGPRLVKIFPLGLVRGWGRVPVQSGTTISWADFVCYIRRGVAFEPYLVVETKMPGDLEEEPSEEGVIQAESYAERLGAPFFAVAKGGGPDDWLWFLTGRTQGSSIRLREPAPLPDEELLPVGDRWSPKIGIKVQSLIDIFERRLDDIYNTECKKKGENPDCDVCRSHPSDNGHHWDCLLWDTFLHDRTSKAIGKILRGTKLLSIDDLEGITPNIIGNLAKLNFKRLTRRFAMGTEDFRDRIRRAFSHLTDESIDAEERFRKAVPTKSEYKIPHCASYLVSILMSAINPKRYLVVKDEQIRPALVKMDLVDIFPEGINDRNHAGKIYELYNEIGMALYPHFRNEFELDLAIVHNFLWHLVEFYIPSGRKRWVGDIA